MPPAQHLWQRSWGEGRRGQRGLKWQDTAPQGDTQHHLPQDSFFRSFQRAKHASSLGLRVLCEQHLCLSQLAHEVGERDPNHRMESFELVASLG